MITIEKTNVDLAYEEIKKDLKAWSKKTGVKLSVTRPDYLNFSVAILSTKEFITEKEYHQLNVYHLEDADSLNELGKKYAFEIRDILTKNIEMHEKHDGSTVPSFYYSIDIGKWNKRYQSECYTRNITLDEALKLKLDLGKILEKNQKLSPDNRTAIEKYLGLKTMFSA